MDANLNDLKQLLIENCMLRLTPDEISETAPLFDPQGLGLDSIDALQLAVAVEKAYGVSIKDATVAREALQSLAALRTWLGSQKAAA
jgi:acyl carrier protein